MILNMFYSVLLFGLNFNFKWRQVVGGYDVSVTMFIVLNVAYFFIFPKGISWITWTFWEVNLV